MLRSGFIPGALAATLCCLPAALAAEADASSLTGGDATRIGVYPLERLGPADAAYDRLQLSLRANLALFPKVEAFDLATPTRCQADELACLVQAGRLSAADQVVHGSVERFNDGYAVRLQLIDVGRTTRREVKTLVQGGAADLAASMELAACQLVTTEPCEGTLEVKGAPGARVLVSSKDVGETPYEGKQRIGRFPVRVTRGAMSTPDTLVGLSFHQRTTFTLEEKGGAIALRQDDFDNLPMPDLPPLEEEPPAAPPGPVAAAEPPPAPPVVEPPVKASPPVAEAVPPSSAFASPPAPAAPGEEPSKLLPKAFWGTLVVGGVLVTSGALFGLSSQLKANEANAKFERGSLAPGDEQLHTQSRSRASAANLQFGLGGVALGVAALLYVLEPSVLGGGGDVSLELSAGASTAVVGARGSF